MQTIKLGELTAGILNAGDDENVLTIPLSNIALPNGCYISAVYLKPQEDFTTTESDLFPTMDIQVNGVSLLNGNPIPLTDIALVDGVSNNGMIWMPKAIQKQFAVPAEANMVLTYGEDEVNPQDYEIGKFEVWVKTEYFPR